MNKRKVCLFTAHSPQTGGGGVILRSLIAALPELDIVWFYVGNAPVAGYENGYLGKALMGGSFINDAWQTRQMLADKRMGWINTMVSQLSKVDCEIYWMVSHNEGLRLALELTRTQSRPVHLTVHDDWAGALCARSVRYRFFGGLANRLTVSALKAVHSFDVISRGMRNYYQQLSKKQGEICHRYLPEGAVKQNNLPGETASSQLIAGHIGSVYDKADFIAFIAAFKQFGELKGKNAILQLWGCHLTINDIPDNLKANVRFYPTLPEGQVIPELRKCRFVYAMYPQAKALRVFSQTSLPTKLTSYLQAGCPIFGHGPTNSTLAAFLTDTGLGEMWTTGNTIDALHNFEALITRDIVYQQLEAARRLYFGEENLAVMRHVLNDEG